MILYNIQGSFLNIFMNKSSRFIDTAHTGMVKFKQ